VTEFETEVQRS